MAHDAYLNFTSRPSVKVNLSTIKDNYKALLKKVGSTKVGASIKANAYGLGSERVGKALYGAGCRNFFVATAGEGQTLRRAIGENASIYVFNGPAPHDIPLYFGAQLKPVINSLTQAQIWAGAVKGVKKAPYSALHIDTGINRLGLSETEVLQLSGDKNLRDTLQVDHIMSHLACAPDPSHPLNAQQLNKFRRLSARFPLKPLSLANSAGIYLGRAYHFDLVRPGIGLYGGKATLRPETEITRPAVSLMAPILQIKSIKKGDGLGYNASFKAPQNMTTLTVGAGYADGIPIASSSQGQTSSHFASYKGERLPIIGRVSMDLTILDASQIKSPLRIGEWVEFLGDNLEHDSQSAQTLNYELLTRLSQRARYIYS